VSALPDLEGMDRDALVALWSATLGGVPPSRLSRPFLRRMLAWDLQARALGGLPAAVRRKLDSLAAAQASGKERTATSPRLKPGGRLLREWNGVTHVVDVVEGGFLWRGERHRSLSAIARAITGAHWSGPRFFGLQEGGGTAKAKRPLAASAAQLEQPRAGRALGTARASSPSPAPKRPHTRSAPSHTANQTASAEVAA
jgi:hypothetical protein